MYQHKQSFPKLAHPKTNGDHQTMAVYRRIVNKTNGDNKATEGVEKGETAASEPSSTLTGKRAVRCSATVSISCSSYEFALLQYIILKINS